MLNIMESQRKHGYAFLCSLLLLLALSACGFQLRGSGSSLEGKQVAIETATPFNDFERQLQRRLVAQGANIVSIERPSHEAVRLVLASLETERRVVTRDSFGRAAGIELVMLLEYLIVSSEDATGQETPEKIMPERMSARREFAYNRTLVTGQSAEEKALIRDMYQELIGRLMVEMAQKSPES